MSHDPSPHSTEAAQDHLAVSELSAESCRDRERLKEFVQSRISRNGWPIHSRTLHRHIQAEGLDLQSAHHFSMPLDRLQRLLRRFHERARRIERVLNIDNAFHTVIHNYEVLLRLLLLEWPSERPLPEALEASVRRPYHDIHEINPVIISTIRSMVDAGVSPSRIARDILAALGHDYGHTGGTDRYRDDGEPAPLTHEETAERHVAKMGLELGFPPALIVEALAGIRSTTFFSRPGRDRIQADNDFERRLMLADVFGCVLPPAQWLTHVGVPVLKEKIPTWTRRFREIPDEIQDLEERLRTAPEDAPQRQEWESRLKGLRNEDALIVKDVPEWLQSERGFFRFLQTARLEPVPEGVRLWEPILTHKIALVDRLLARPDLMTPLAEAGFPLLQRFSEELCHQTDIRGWMAQDDVPPALREVLEAFLAPDV